MAILKSHIQMDIHTKVGIAMVNMLGMEKYSLIQIIIIKEIGSMEQNVVRELLKQKMGVFMKGILSRENIKDME